VSDVRHHTAQVPATSANLGPGFDAFGVALDLHLAVRTLPRDAQDARVVCVDVEAAELPTGDDNLIWRSFVTFCERHEVAVPEVALRTTSEIPLERGLGSSSAAIVAGLVLARALTGVVIGDRDLVTLACELEGHADNVAPALLGGLVACTTGDDGSLVVRRINPTPNLRPLALVPPSRQATTEARAVLPQTLTREDVVLQAGRAGHVLAALIGSWPVAVAASGDRLHETTRLHGMEATGAVVAELRRAGLHAWLSGAGPAVAVAIPVRDDAAIGAAGAIAQTHGFEVHQTGFELSGALVCPEDGCALAGTGGCMQCPRRRV
jgi:homoserine kinase